MRSLFTAACVAYTAQCVSLSAQIASLGQIDQQLAQEIETTFAQLKDIDATVYGEVTSGYENVLAQVKDGADETAIDAALQSLDNHLRRPPYFVQALDLLDALKKQIWQQISERDQANDTLQTQLDDKTKQCAAASEAAQASLATAHQEVVEAKEESAKCTNEKQALETQIAAHELDDTAQDAEIKNLTDQLATTATERDNAKIEKEECDTQLTEKDQAIKDQKGNFDSCDASKTILEAELGEVKEELAAAPKVCTNKCPHGQVIVNTDNCKCGFCTRWIHHGGLHKSIRNVLYSINIPKSLNTSKDPMGAVEACENLCEANLLCSNILWRYSGDNLWCELNQNIKGQQGVNKYVSKEYNWGTLSRVKGDQGQTNCPALDDWYIYVDNPTRYPSSSWPEGDTRRRCEWTTWSC